MEKIPLKGPSGQIWIIESGLIEWPRYKGHSYVCTFQDFHLNFALEHAPNSRARQAHGKWCESCKAICISECSATNLNCRIFDIFYKEMQKYPTISIYF
jgi:hypothetical protein